MDLLTLQFDAKTIAAKTEAIAHEFCASADDIREPNFTKIAATDLRLLFELYDRHFFEGWLDRCLARQSADPVAFRVSSRMTKAGGKTTRRRVRSLSHRRPYAFEIAVSGRLLFLSFDDVQRPVRIGGLVCHSRLDALQRILEHEIIHLVELMQCGTSSCNQPRFKALIQAVFGHGEVRHELITPAEDAAVRHQVVVGSIVQFEFEGRQLTGRVNRINQRATVLVEDSDGQPYSDGKRYAKYYVPLHQLTLAKPGVMKRCNGHPPHTPPPTPSSPTSTPAASAVRR